MRLIFKTWWPLAASWMLMAVEFPLASAFIARMPDPEINLAAFGGVAFPILFMIEAPIEMLLAASTALSRDWPAYLKLRRFTLVMGVGLIALFSIAVFTPLYFFITEQLIGVPQEVVQPARRALYYMTFFPLVVAYRRFQQGVLIRFDHSRAVGTGTLIRLSVGAALLVIGYATGSVQGADLGAAALICGSICEALYSRWAVQSVLVKQVQKAEPGEIITTPGFLKFYLPLAATTIIMFFFESVGAAAISRMPQPLESLAVWPVASGFIFILSAAGVAYNEVVVALLDRPGSYALLRRFALVLAGGITVLTFLFAVTPLAGIWFRRVAALAEPLAVMGQRSFWFFLILPALSVLMSWIQGLILPGRKTRGITESILVSFATLLIVLGAGIAWGRTPGIYIGALAYLANMLAQAGWLYMRSRPIANRISKGAVSVPTL